MIRSGSEKSERARVLDWAIALSAAVFGILFLVPLTGIALGFDEFAGLGAELWTLGNYVYIVVMGVSLAAFALGVVRRLNRK